MKLVSNLQYKSIYNNYKEWVFEEWRNGNFNELEALEYIVKEYDNKMMDTINITMYLRPLTYKEYYNRRKEINEYING